MTKTALMVMDYQVGLIERMKGVADILPQLSRTINEARNAGIAIIFVTISFRPGYPELSAHNASAERIKSMGSVQDGAPAVQVHPDLPIAPTDIFVTKRRVSAFGGSDLDVVLRGLGAEKLVVAGIATSGVVLSTVRQAADLDFELTVLKDLCMDPDAEVQEVLMEKVFVRQAQVMTSDAWVASLGWV